MTEKPLDVILPTLDAPDGLPAVIEQLMMELEFTESAVEAGVADEPIMEVEDTFGHPGASMQTGLLCRSVRTTASHRLQVAMIDPWFCV